jgi:hypothetical protein
VRVRVSVRETDTDGDALTDLVSVVDRVPVRDCVPLGGIRDEDRAGVADTVCVRVGDVDREGVREAVRVRDALDGDGEGDGDLDGGGGDRERLTDREGVRLNVGVIDGVEEAVFVSDAVAVAVEPPKG